MTGGADRGVSVSSRWSPLKVRVEIHRHDGDRWDAQRYATAYRVGVEMLAVLELTAVVCGALALYAR